MDCLPGRSWSGETFSDWLLVIERTHRETVTTLKVHSEFALEVGSARHSPHKHQS